MEEEDRSSKALSKAWQLWKTYGEHLIAPLILLGIFLLVFNIVEENKLKKEIRDNCGYYDSKEKIMCVCDKGSVDMFKGNLPSLSNQTLEGYGANSDYSPSPDS